MVRFCALLLWLGLGRAAPEPPFDVIVVGGEPEGIAAATAAAEEGARTLLPSEDARLGGLFARWWTRVGRGPAFTEDGLPVDSAHDVLTRGGAYALAAALAPAPKP